MAPKVTQKGIKKTGKGPTRDEKGRFISPINGQPVPKGRPFVAGDARAREMQRRSTEAKKARGDLRRLCQAWMETEIDDNGEKITGGEKMVQVAVQQIKNPRFWELLRDTAGFKPVDKVMVAEIDPEVIDEVEQMVKESGSN